MIKDLNLAWITLHHGKFLLMMMQRLIHRMVILKAVFIFMSTVIKMIGSIYMDRIRTLHCRLKGWVKNF